MYKKFSIVAGVAMFLGASLLAVHANVANAQTPPEQKPQQVAQQTYNFSTNITTNDPAKKSEIAKLQDFLSSLNLIRIIDDEDKGLFGPKTKTAVKKLQEHFHLAQTGTLGPQTRANINNLFANPQVLGAAVSASQLKNKPATTFTKFLAAGSKDKEVTLLQNFLAGKGYFSSKISGVFDTATIKALKNFQKDNSVPVNGRVDASTRTLLVKILSQGQAAIPGVTFNTNPASGVTSDSATLNATIKGVMNAKKGKDQTVYFEYGTDAKNLDMMSPISAGPIDSDYSATINNLTPFTTYYYRIVINDGPNSIPQNHIQAANTRSFITPDLAIAGIYLQGKVSSNETWGTTLSSVTGDTITLNWYAMEEFTDCQGIVVSATQEQSWAGVALASLSPANSFTTLDSNIGIPDSKTVYRIRCKQAATGAVIDSNKVTVNRIFPVAICNVANPMFTITTDPVIPGMSSGNMTFSASYSRLCGPTFYGWWEYGQSSAFGSKTPMTIRQNLEPLQAGNPPATGWFGVWSESVTVSPHTLYYVRACGKESNNVACGPIATFISN